jgi:hypothetical protein
VAAVVIADAAVDQDGVMRRFHHTGLETQDQHVVGVERAGLLHPRPVLGQDFRRQARQHLQRRQQGGFLFDDAVNGEIADGKLEAHASFLLFFLNEISVCPGHTE